MKRILALTVILGGLSGALAQGTFNFTADLNGQNEIPPNDSPAYGTGIFELSGGALNYSIGFSIGLITNVTINGPSTANSTAPVLFNLGPASVIINPPLPPTIITEVSGTINNLTSTQIDDLLAGLWYVNVYTSSGNFPEGEIRGQIVPVPEPSTWALLASGGVVVWWYGRQKRKG